MGKRKIGVIGAMENEVRILRRNMNITFEETVAGMTFSEGTMGNTPLVLVQSGIGKVNAGICACLLIDHFGCDAIINSGIAGSLNNDLEIEDIVVSVDALQHDMDVTGLGYEKGTVPGVSVRAFPADEELRRDVVEAVRVVAPEVNVVEGRVVSGDLFVCNKEDKHRIARETGGLCAEMEGAAAAQAAYLFHVPFVIVRAISDKADEIAQKTFAEIEEEASLRSSAIMAAVLERLGENG
ncbi:MAG: 5'-methylthioadenosine/adenosylhomocysteine nucleosidase [Solobacterium sp.]|nr:5'-methylthioadenosine/adenosylhomocysteine nucleosidase [Solobacterium sp.]